MITMVRLFLATLLLAPTLSEAREIAVRSGEHADFSRLVIYTDTNDVAEFNQTPKGYVLSTKDPSNTFNTKRVFEKIPRTRISAVFSAQDGSLKIIADCDCHAKTERLPSGPYVIDIFDGPSGKNPETLVAHSKRDAPAQSPATSLTPSAVRLGLPIGQTSSDKPEEASTKDTIAERPSKDADEAAAVQTTDRLTEDTLLAQLSRAAAQGLVSTSVDQLLPVADTDAPGLTSAEPPDVPAPETVLVTPDDHIAIQTAVDREANSNLGHTMVTENGVRCLDADAFAIAHWATNEGRELDFSSQRAELFGEFDRLNETALNRLVRNQIYLTLGAEALSYLSAFPNEISEHAVLIAMAEVMDQGESSHSEFLAPQLICDGEVALWAVLAQPALRAGTEINSSGVLRAFSALPTHLRTHLGPLLVEKFLSGADRATAHEINQVLERTQSEDLHPPSLSNARLQVLEGDKHRGLQQLENIINADVDTAAEAMLLNVDTLIASDEGIPERTLELLSTLAYENRATEIGSQLAHAELRALAHVGRIEQAFDAYQALESPDFEARAQLLATLAQALTEKASDAVFLRFALFPDRWTDATNSARFAIAQRLSRLGFAEPAKQMVLLDQQPPDKNERILIARSALTEGRPEVALGYLAGLDSPDALELRAASLSGLGRHEDAAELFAILQKPDATLSELWRSGTWAALGRSPNETLAATASLVSSSDAQLADATTLSAYQSLLTASAGARTTLDRLLAEFPTP